MTNDQFEVPPSSPQGGPRPSRPKWPLFLTLGVLVVCGGCLFFTMILALGISAGPGGGAPVGDGLMERVVEGSGDAKIALIELDGVIARRQAGGMFGAPGVDLVASLKSQFEQAEEDSAVKAVLFSIDSPGGTVTASDQIWHIVSEFKQRTSKPVVIHMGAVCASGGYYIAVAGDEIFCEPTTITGSIGVVLSTLNFHDFLQEYKIQDVTLTSGPNKDLLSPTGPRRAEHEEILRAMITDAYERFTELVAKGRGIKVDDVRKVADGRIYTAKQALELKFVDQIGYREDALARATSLGGVTQARLVRYARPPTFADILSGNVAARSPVPSLDMGLLDRLGAPRLMAIWRVR